MAEVQGAKIWWRWANHSMEPWARLWHIKYDQDRPNKQLIRFNEELNGSPIWLKALSGRHIVQDHSFWEIRGGGEQQNSGTIHGINSPSLGLTQDGSS